MFIAHVYGIDLSVSDYMLVIAMAVLASIAMAVLASIAMAVLASIGTAGVPSGR